MKEKNKAKRKGVTLDPKLHRRLKIKAAKENRKRYQQMMEGR